MNTEGVSSAARMLVLIYLYLKVAATSLKLEIRLVHVYQVGLKGMFSSGIEGALASTLNRDFNWK